MKPRVYYGPMPRIRTNDKDMFSKPNSECVALYLDKAERPVIVSRVSNTTMPYRVAVGMSVVVFPTLLDAKNYCDKRFKEVRD